MTKSRRVSGTTAQTLKRAAPKARKHIDQENACRLTSCSNSGDRQDRYTACADASSGGASIADLMKTAGWQAHSVRGAISGAIKEKLGLSVVSERVDGVRLYRITDSSAA